MEDSPKDILSPILSKPNIQRQIGFLEDAVKQAKKRVDFAIANDTEIQRGIEVVERFLRKKRRVCYGGQAINSLLSKGRKFYDEKYSIPDYDFFTPSYKEDADELIAELKKEGFTEVHMKYSMHEGTIKILMNFVPVADCTDMHPSLFKIIQSRAKVVDGICFTDPEFLRMMMYLELSHPRGEVDRWKKVYERLVLLNTEYPPTTCTDPIRVPTNVTKQERSTVLELVAKRKRVLVGPECIALMDLAGQAKISAEKLVSMDGPVIFMSPQASVDGEDIGDMIRGLQSGHGKVTVTSEKALYSSLFNFTVVKHMKRPIALIFQEDSCHSYSTLHLSNGVAMRTGSFDTILELYYSIHIFGKKELAFFAMPVACLINKLHSIEARARMRPSEYVPAFAVRCSGHQEGIATLLKKRVKRTELERAEKAAETKKGGRLIRGRKTRKISH
uniref:Poly(A) polymerase catalytic subunit domain-containing protein n=1 Tax=viral metagenome TaxID=1070528 RepID=A0A6C0L7S0_9ZZZZ